MVFEEPLLVSTYAPNIGNIDDVLNLMPVLQLQVPMATALFRAFCDSLTPQPTKTTQATAPASLVLCHRNDNGQHDTGLRICMYVDFLFLFSLPVLFTLQSQI